MQARAQQALRFTVSAMTSPNHTPRTSYTSLSANGGHDQQAAISRGADAMPQQLNSLRSSDRSARQLAEDSAGRRSHTSLASEEHAKLGGSRRRSYTSITPQQALHTLSQLSSSHLDGQTGAGLSKTSKSTRASFSHDNPLFAADASDMNLTTPPSRHTEQHERRGLSGTPYYTPVPQQQQ
eukprot:jgi/Chrzof1/11066/Cz05g22070.t1